MKISGLVLGYHGCDKSIVDKIVATPQHLQKSENSYDWLGSGVYFWLNSPSRAIEFAQSISKNPNKTKDNKITTPDVVGAVIDLGNCLDLTEYSCLIELKNAHKSLIELCNKFNLPIPKNKKLYEKDNDIIIRELDCAVIKTLHNFRQKNNLQPYDSVMGMFNEGKALFEGTQIMEKTHTQICIRNLDCIKGYFKIL